MKVGQLLAEKESKRVESIAPDSTLRETAKKLIQHRIGALVVLDKSNQLKGIISERDLVQVVANFDPELVEHRVSEVMTCSVITCSPTDEIAYVLRLMNTNAIRHMPVLENEELIGMLSIRELTTAYELLQLEANIDPLTEVSIRRPFLKTLNKEFDRSRELGHPISVAMLDVDDFKNVNDTHGHGAGDETLRVVSGMLIREFRTIDLVGRLGGEEFAVVFPETDLAGAQIACERLVANIRETPVPIGDEEIKVTVSVGVAGASSETIDGPNILSKADELLYQAKAGGKDRVVVEGDSKNRRTSL